VAEARRAEAEELAEAVGSRGSGVLGSRQPSRPFWNWKSLSSPRQSEKEK
jgi:hypothetical protein